MKQTLAIVGTGVSGLGAAYFLKNDYDLTIFESGDYVGGHTNTVDVDEDQEHFEPLDENEDAIE